MRIVRLHGDDAGETHLTPIELPVVDDPGEGIDRVRALGGIPANGVGIAQLINRMPDYGLHPAPKRQLLILLGGEYEITTTTGDQVRLQAGDCLFTDDLLSQGHYTRDVGADPLTLVSIEIPDDWEFPGP